MQKPKLQLKNQNLTSEHLLLPIFLLNFCLPAERVLWQAGILICHFGI
jgi:hypothetical protein